MKPIAPPLLQGQATGSQSSFVVGGAAEIQSPLKRPSYPVRSGGKGELGDMGFTPCSRMRDFNVEVCGLANEQRQVNEQHIQGIVGWEKPSTSMDARKFLDSSPTTEKLVQPEARSNQTHVGSWEGLGKINVMKNDEMDVRLLRWDHEYRGDHQRHPIYSVADGDLHFKTVSANIARQPSTLTMISDSGKITGSILEHKGDADITLVKTLLARLHTLQTILTFSIRYTVVRKLVTG
jgi:hypothetical protein